MSRLPYSRPCSSGPSISLINSSYPPHIHHAVSHCIGRPGRFPLADTDSNNSLSWLPTVADRQMQKGWVSSINMGGERELYHIFHLRSVFSQRHREGSDSRRH